MQKTIQYLGTTLCYTVIGDGKPVVLLHGFGEDSSIFNYQIDFLKEHCQLIVPDLPGSGASPVNNRLATMNDFAACVHAILQQENIDNCTMLGHSMGGYITLAFAEQYMALLNGFGFIHSTAFADSEEKKENRKRGIEMMQEYGSYAFLKNTTPNLFGKKFKEAYPEKIAGLIESGKQFSVDALQQYYRAMMDRPNRTQVLQGSGLPVLFIIGTEDVAAPLNDVLKQTHLANCSYIHILDEIGHMGMWEAPQLLNQYLLDYINK